MIANDFEWFIYGGLITLTAGYSLPGSQSAAAYEVYASGPPKQFQAGYIIEQLPDSVTRYVTNGAGVSIPSENLGYYFGGLRSTSFGPIYYQAGNESDNADVLSTTMIELNLNVQRAEVWTNLTLPTTVPGRINAELVWVPVSKGGVLVAIGGVVDAEYAEYTTSLNATQVAETVSDLPSRRSLANAFTELEKSSLDVNSICVRYRCRNMVSTTDLGDSSTNVDSRMYRHGFSSRWFKP